jgi:hypothetical protein
MPLSPDTMNYLATVLAKVAYTSLLTALALDDDETTLIERWEPVSAHIRRQDRR